MNNKQEGALNAVRRYLCEIDEGIVEEIISEVNNIVLVTIVTGPKDEQNDIMRLIREHYYKFIIGRNGGYFKYDEQWGKHYFGINKLTDIRLF